MTSQRRPTSRRLASRRSGFAVWWLILLVPVLFALFCVVVDLARVWLARIELTNGLESAALAGAQAWGPAGGDTLAARRVAVDFADSNTVLGNPLQFQTNYDGTSGRPNQNATCDGDLVFGGITNNAPPFVFNADALGVSCSGGISPAVRASRTVTVPSSWNFFGLNVGPYSITSNSTAIFDCPTQSIRLIHIEPANFLCSP